MRDDLTSRTFAIGLWMLCISVPLGLTLEALHAFKVPVYLGSPLRRELWTLAHAHANLLGMLCMVMAHTAARWAPASLHRRRVLRGLAIGAVTMPLGFLAGGVLAYEGDPSLGILLVPVGGLVLLWALLRAALNLPRPEAAGD